MPSPFPGMDPFLERPDLWHELHASFAGVAKLSLGPAVGPGYQCRVEEHLFIHERSAEERRLLGRGVLSVHDRDASPTPAGGTAVAPAAPPLRRQLPPAIDVERLRRLEIRDSGTRQVVTVVELLSPTNKRPGGDRDLYLSTRAQLLESDANLVEIDLLRRWPRMPVVDPPACDYLILVSRAWERPTADLWPLSVRDGLPHVPIPLREHEPDVPFDLRAVLDQLYAASNYSPLVYADVPPPPLPPADAEWATRVLRDAGLTPPETHSADSPAE